MSTSATGATHQVPPGAVMSSSKPITSLDFLLNEGQRAAADGFFAFLFNEEPEMIISGAGGVGKTVLLGHLVDVIMPQYRSMCAMIGETAVYTDVVMTSTTNKAAEVLSQAIRRPTSTIHSFLRLKVQDDYQTGRSRISKTNGWEVHSNKIIFVDESSMMDSPLLAMLREGTHNCKIIFVGDHSQLSPVGELISPIYKANLPFFNLTQPMRNAEQPALMAVCEQLRETVATGIFKPIEIVPGVIDWVDDTQMEYAIAQTFHQQTKEARILAYTNERVIEYNEHIREMRGLGGEYGMNELLVSNSAFRSGLNAMSVEEGVEVVDQKAVTSFELIEDLPTGPVHLEVRETTLRTQLGSTLYGIKLPVNREHFTQLTRYYASIKNWRMYFHLKNNFPELRPRDAATVHKAQGSSYDTTFLDLGNMGTCHIPNMMARLLYVGFSRSRQRVVLYGQLPKKYGGLVFH